MRSTYKHIVNLYDAYLPPKNYLGRQHLVERRGDNECFVYIPVGGPALAAEQLRIIDDLDIDMVPLPGDKLHITLVWSDDGNEEAIRQMVESIAPPIHFNIEVASLGILEGGDEPALVWLVNPSPGLMRLQSDLARAAERAGIPTSPFSDPMIYTPHISLAYGMKEKPETLPAINPFSLYINHFLVGRDEHKTMFAVHLPRAMGDRVLVEQSLENRHASPIHPGTGSDQQVHAGEGAGTVESLDDPDIAKKTFEWMISVYGEVPIDKEGMMWIGPDGRLTEVDWHAESIVRFLEDKSPELLAKYGGEKTSDFMKEGQATERAMDALNDFIDRGMVRVQAKRGHSHVSIDVGYPLTRRQKQTIQDIISLIPSERSERAGMTGFQWEFKGTSGFDIADFYRAAGIVERHASPTHPGTGSDQQVHDPTGGGGDGEEWSIKEGGYAEWTDGDHLVKVISDNEDGTVDLEIVSGPDRGSYYDNAYADDLVEYDQDKLDLWTDDGIDATLARAEEIFGLTEDFNEAGYILPGGEMLDFSGKNKGGSWGRRALDHRDIGTAFLDDEPGGTEGMYKFMDDANAIRMNVGQGDLSVDFSGPPTRDQREMIMSIALQQSDTIYWDVTRWNDESKSSSTIDGGSVSPDYDEIQEMLESIRGIYYRQRSWLIRALDELRNFILRGGPGSGHHGHAGRPGKVGGSSPGTDVYDSKYPLAGDVVSGLEVRYPIPNTDSIAASFLEWEELKGIREVHFADFPLLADEPSSYSVDEQERKEELARQIKENKWIYPLIVGVDHKGPWVVEGGHRFDALRMLGIESFPALVVLDLDLLTERHASEIHPGTGSDQQVHDPTGGAGGSKKGDVGLAFETWKKQPFDKALAASYADAIEEKFGLTPQDKITNASWIAPDGRAVGEGSTYEETSKHALSAVNGVDTDDFTISETQVIQAGLIRHSFWAYGQEAFIISGTDTLTSEQKRTIQSIMDARVNQVAGRELPSGRDTELVGLRMYVVEEVPPYLDPISRELDSVKSAQLMRLLGLKRSEWRVSSHDDNLLVSTAPRLLQSGEWITQSDIVERHGARSVVGILRRVVQKGGAGSGYHDPHKGRKGKIGGSSPRDGGGGAESGSGEDGGGMRTPKASFQKGYAGTSDAFLISTEGGASAKGYLSNADFPNQKSEKTRGELFYVEVPEAERRKGLGTSLALDSLQKMLDEGTETVNMDTTTPEGQALVDSLLEKGHIEGPIQESETGKAEYKIGDLGGDGVGEDAPVQFGREQQAEADEWARANLPDRDAYERMEQEALGDYKNSINPYTALNRALRRGEVISEPFLSQLQENIDSAMRKSELPNDMVLYRGIRMFPSEGGKFDYEDVLKVGSTFTDNAYLSTTLTLAEAEGFSRSREVRQVVFRIKVPAGTPAIYMENFAEAGLKGYNEEEILLDRGLKFRITSTQTIAAEEFESSDLPSDIELWEAEVIGRDESKRRED